MKFLLLGLFIAAVAAAPKLRKVENDQEIIPGPVILPEPALPVVVPESVILPAPQLPVVVPDNVVLPEPELPVVVPGPGVILPAPELPVLPEPAPELP
ncbi:unnamed protein product, partial [Brenthis ino]